MAPCSLHDPSTLRWWNFGQEALLLLETSPRLAAKLFDSALVHHTPYLPGFRIPQSWEEEVYRQVTGWHIPFTKGIRNRVLYFKPAYKMRWRYVCISTQSDNGDIRIPAFVTFLRTALLLHPSNGNARAVAKSAVQVAMTVSFRVCEIPRTAWPPKTLPGWSRLTGWSLPPEKSTANNDQGWHQPNPTKPRAPALRSTLHLPKASTLTHLGWCLETPAWW